MNKNENNREMKFERKGRFWTIKEKNAKNIIYRQQFEKKEISFCEVLHLWLEKNRLKLKPQSYADYKFMIDSHISPIIGSIPITCINVNCINSFLYEKSKNGRLDGKGGLSVNYIKKLSFIMISTLDYAAEEGFCLPLCGSVTLPQRKRAELEVLSVKEQIVLEKFIRNNFDIKKLGVLLSLFAGLRIGEVCGLKWGDIDFERQTIHVRHTIERIKNIDGHSYENKTKLVLLETKTFSSNRVIPISPELLEPLIKFRNEDNVYLLQGKTYAYTDPRTYQYCFQGYLKECNLRSINYHALRHTFATRCIEFGMDAKTLSEILGHANVNITLNTYVHSSLEHKRNQLQKVSFLLGQQCQ